MQNLRIQPIPNDNRLVQKSELIALANFKVNLQVQILGSSLEGVRMKSSQIGVTMIPVGEEIQGSNWKFWQSPVDVTQGMSPVAGQLDLDDRSYSRLGTNFTPDNPAVNFEDVRFKLYLNGSLVEVVYYQINDGSDYTFTIPTRQYTTDDAFILTIERSTSTNVLINQDYNYNYVASSNYNSLCSYVLNRNVPIYNTSSNLSPEVGDVLEFANGQMLDNGFYMFMNQSNSRMWVRIANAQFGIRHVAEIGIC
ncbi:MAG: hypothetical protein EOO89_32295 [Pedobacter sp.]|nr:MAG: hypothetical protein EOO89_32295 [Pedobacter sp.]